MFELDMSAFMKQEQLTDEDVRRIIAEHDPWFHRIAFTNGITTPGRDPSAVKLHALRLPPRLDGMTVLDIGAYEGYFSFQCEARGASRVVACDSFIWEWNDGSVLDNFRLIKRLLRSNVGEARVTVEDLSPATTGVFDITLFLGVLYHTENMLQYLANVRSVTGRMCVIETLVDMLDVDVPCAAYYPAGSLNNDPTNFWGPNILCVEDMAKRVGFSHIELIGLWDVNTRAALAGQNKDTALKSGRAVWHALV